MSSPLEKTPLSKDEIAKLIADDIPTGSFVNLGIGQPTLVADHLDLETRRRAAHRERHARDGPRGRR